MREYQQMAPQKLTDVCLESILWNKVPVEFQREVKEITTDGSVHELFHKLLRVEAGMLAVRREEVSQDLEVVRLVTGGTLSLQLHPLVTSILRWRQR